MKEIREDLQEIKSDIKKAAQQPKVEELAKTWQPIILKLIELVGTAFTILADVIGAVKIMGK